MMNITKFGFLNINRQFIGVADELEGIMKDKGIEYIMLVETNLRRADTCPFRGIVAEARGEKPGAIGGRPRAKDGVLVATLTDKLQSCMIETNEDGKWVVVEIGGIIFIVSYLSPSLSMEDIRQFDEVKTRIFSRFQGRPVICIGDFNTRMGDQLGDHGTCSCPERRQWMDEWLNSGEWHRMEPTAGKWTTFDLKGGRGITDLVIGNDLGCNVVTNIQVHEELVIGAVDHRLITFDVSTDMLLQKPP